MELIFLKITRAILFICLAVFIRQSDCLAQPIRSSAQRELRIVDPTSITGGGIGIRAATGTSSYILTLPQTAPSVNQNFSVSAINGANITLTWNTPLTALSGSANYIAKFTNSNTIGNSQVFDNGTNIGIGTTTSGSRLQVNGNAAIGYSASIAAPTNGLAVSGNLAVGQTSALYKVDVLGSSRLGNTSNNTEAITFLDDLSTKTHIGSGFGSTFIQNNYYNNGSADIFDDNTKPSSTVVLTAGTLNFRTGAANVVPSTKVSINNSGILFAGNGETNASPSTGIISGTGGTGTNIAGAEFRIRGGTSTGSGKGGPITFYTSAAGTAGTGVNAGVERMRIDNAGNVGIGTSMPSERLEVVGNIKTEAPLGGTAAGWKLGSVVPSYMVLDENYYLEVEVAGLAYRIALARPGEPHPEATPLSSPDGYVPYYGPEPSRSKLPTVVEKISELQKEVKQLQETITFLKSKIK